MYLPAIPPNSSIHGALRAWCWGFLQDVLNEHSGSFAQAHMLKDTRVFQPPETLFNKVVLREIHKASPPLPANFQGVPDLAQAAILGQAGGLEFGVGAFTPRRVPLRRVDQAQPSLIFPRGCSYIDAVASQGRNPLRQLRAWKVTHGLLTFSTLRV